MDPAADQVLEDLGPEALALPTPQDPLWTRRVERRDRPAKPRTSLFPSRSMPTATNKEISSSFPSSVRSLAQ